ncbi:polyphosphate kinase 1 [Proteiniclasticum sp. SCR006]|uniref:Polyphosphate kinase n=2 Tax=Proteiniclasticum aestuarii TaxID=2817862 RepID=A0A939KGP6_9CLOT|nr:polyphosphate kinase 1 [Proteiniclasticum aestuarii]
MDQYQSEPKDFINRELSFLEFNHRVLEEARDSNNPLLERLKFAAIVISNLDEFYMIRYGTLSDQIHAKIYKRDSSGLTPKEQTQAINKRTGVLLKDLYELINGDIRKELKKLGIEFVNHKDLDEDQKEFINKLYTDSIYPVLTPMVVDSTRPFPLITSETLNIAVLLEDKKSLENHHIGTIQVPNVLDRFYYLPGSTEESRKYIMLEEILKLKITDLFNAFDILGYSCYRISRNADLEYNEEEADDLLEVIKETIKLRKWGNVIKLEVEDNVSEELLEYLMDEFEITANNVFKIRGPLDLRFLHKVSSLPADDALRFKEIIPLPVPELLIHEDLFQSIAHKDVLLHHPYDSFSTIIKLIKQASVDPDVLAIKQTLYRVSGNSPIVKALAEAAENGKQVTVLVELKARFDEENNINWALRLEKAGCHVIYGVTGLKTHCKALLIIRRENNEIKRYFHVGTGNYNDITAKLYTDVSLVSCNGELAKDISDIFNRLSGHYRYDKMRQATLAPEDMRDKFTELIENERKLAKDGKKALIIAKMNSLVDKDIIEKLYAASRDGVEIELIIRGICCLRPGVKGISENITVRSIVGRFLEHSRIFYFHNNGEEDMYIGSADWMERNLNKRIELLIPIHNSEAKHKLKTILEYNLKDNMKARVLQSDGTYKHIQTKDDPFNCQEELILRTQKKFNKYKKRLAKLQQEGHYST